MTFPRIVGALEQLVNICAQKSRELLMYFLRNKMRQERDKREKKRQLGGSNASPLQKIISRKQCRNQLDQGRLPGVLATKLLYLSI
jgi:hypothetical protein